MRRMICTVGATCALALGLNLFFSPSELRASEAQASIVGGLCCGGQTTGNCNSDSSCTTQGDTGRFTWCEPGNNKECSDQSGHCPVCTWLSNQSC